MKKKRSRIRLLSGLLAAILAILCGVPAWAAPEEPGYVRTVFNKTNGLATDEANAVLQTRDGYLWVGSFGGLLRYDGTTFRNFSTEGAISTPSIRTLYEDSSGRLWIGSSDGGVFLYENGAFTAVPCTEEYGFLSMRDFAESSDGTIYAASTSGLGKIQNGTLTPLDDPQVTGETIYSLGFDRYGRLWCVLNSGGCAVLENDRVLAILPPYLFFDNGRKVTCLATDSENNVYLGTDGEELAKVACTGEALDGSEFSTRLYHVPDAAGHNRIRVTGDGDMLVSGQQGFAWVKPDGTLVDPHSAGVTAAVNCAILDSEGDVWLASSDEGLVRYVPGYFGSPNIETGLADVAINAVTAAGGLYYAATDLGLFAFDSEWSPVQNALTQTLANVHVQNLMADSRGRLWCGTSSNQGLVRYDPATGEILSFGPQNGLESTNIHVSYEMMDGTVAVGTQDGLALIRGDKVIAFFDKDNGMETQSILCLVEAPNGVLMAGSAGSGIYAVDTAGGQLRRYSHEQGLNDGVVLRIVPEEGGAGSFVSAGSHLYYWRDGTFRRLDNLEIGVGSIFDVCEKNGRLWLMQDSGLYAVDKEQLLAGETPHAARYGISDGLTGSLRVNTWNYMSPEGRLYLATRNGISIFDFRTIEHAIPQPVIGKVRVDNETYESPEQVILSKNNRRMTISFSALTFSGTADLCIAYQLVGFARNETMLYGSSGSVSYTNLDGGTYTFRLRVFDPDEPEVQEVREITVIKEKRLSEQPLAWVFGLVLLGVVAFGSAQLVVRTRVKRLNRQRQMYRNIVGQALRTFANTIDAKDPYTNGHSVRVALYAKEIARRMGYSEIDQETVYYVALLHDIGKIAIPDSILNKAGALTPEERAIIQTHPEKGGEILRDFTALKGIADGARYHHERYDGKGYCAGLAGEDIPLMGRIICVADSYDAMSSDRCYRKALPPEQILEELQKGSGTQFDPKIAAIMEDMIREGVVPVDSPVGEKPTAPRG